MNTDHDQPTRPEILEAIGGELMRAARDNPRARSGWLDRVPRRIAVPLAVALALPVGAGIAFASVSLTGDKDAPSVSKPVYEPAVADGGPPMQGVNPGDVVGYLDLDTGQLIACPDGDPLTRAYGERQPACSDGSIPEKYTSQEAVWEQFLSEQENSATPQPPENGPNFQILLNQK